MHVRARGSIGERSIRELQRAADRREDSCWIDRSAYGGGESQVVRHCGRHSCRVPRQSFKQGQIDEIVDDLVHAYPSCDGVNVILLDDGPTAVALVVARVDIKS